MLTETWIQRKNWSTRTKRRKEQQILKVTIFMEMYIKILSPSAVFTTTAVIVTIRGRTSRKKGKADGAVGLLISILFFSSPDRPKPKWVHGSNKKSKRHTHSGDIEKHGEKAKFRRVFFFRKNKNPAHTKNAKSDWVWMEKNPYRHKARKAKRAGRHREKREEKKDWLRLTGRGGGREEEEVHYILYQKHIFKVNSQPKKKSFSNVSFAFFFIMSPQSNWISFSLAVSPSSFCYAIRITGLAWSEGCCAPLPFIAIAALSAKEMVKKEGNGWRWRVKENCKVKLTTHLPALTALDFHQIFRVAYDVGHHINVVLEREYHWSAVGRRDGDWVAI